MKIKITFLLTVIIICLITNLNAQTKPVLRDIHDPLLKQLIKDKKNVHFITTNDVRGVTIKFYEEPLVIKNNSLPVRQYDKSLAANFHLTKDINAQTDANPSNNNFFTNKPYAILNSIMYFSANDGIHGTELWRSDGTAAGTYLVKDLTPGISSSFPYEIIAAGNKIFFVTENPVSFSYKLWVSDGTQPGTFMLKDLSRQGPGVNGAYLLTNVSGSAYFFVADINTYQPQLWKTDGTISNTVLVKDFTSIGQIPMQPNTAQGLFYFTIFSNSTGRELWRADGSVAGSFMVKDISSSTDLFTGPYQLTPFNNKLYFSADDGTGRKLWLTDGTTEGTVLATGQNNVSLTGDYGLIFTNSQFAVLGSNFFTAATTITTGTELFSYNITAGFSLVKDISPGPPGGYIDQLTPVGNHIAFEYDDTAQRRFELWGSDGTAAKTFLIKSLDNHSSFFNYLTAGNNLLYFVTKTTGEGYELWKTAGTANSTAIVKDIYAGATSSNPLCLTYFNKKIYFNAASKTAGSELWQTDGTDANTTMVTEINQTSTNFSGPNIYNGYIVGLSLGIGINNTLYFTATKPETGYELYRSDGTTAGTSLTTDLLPGEDGSYPQLFMNRNNAVYFLAHNIDSTRNPIDNIYKIDSTGNTTVNASASLGYINSYDVDDNGIVFYIKYNNLNGKFELWRSDGSENGSFMLTDKVASYNYIYTVKTAGKKAYFTASDGNGIELWTSNGTIAGTKMTKDIYAGGGGSNPYSLYTYNNNIFFGANDGSGNALWKSNGTASGTVKVKDIEPYGAINYGLNYNDFFCVANNILYMNASTATAGSELWKTNGTATGTKIVKDINIGSDGSNPTFLTNVNGGLFFTVYNQLWKTDGTKANTVLIKELPGYFFNERCASGGKFFFNKDQLLWVSDGTDAGTRQVSDNGLNGLSLITNLAAAGNNIFFNAYSDLYNYEMYSGDATKVVASPSAINNDMQIQKQASFTAAVLQNPVIASINLQVQSAMDQTINISVSNEQGNLVKQQKLIVTKGINKVNISVAGRQGGVYLVKLSNNTGDNVYLSVLK